MFCPSLVQSLITIPPPSEKACLSCMARTGLSGLMVQKRRSLQMAASHHHCHRVGAARPPHGSSSAAQLAASRAALKHGCSGMPMRAGHATAARTTGVAQQDSALAWPRARRRGVKVLSPFRANYSWNYPGSSSESHSDSAPCTAVRAAPISASAGMRSFLNVLSKFCAT